MEAYPNIRVKSNSESVWQEIKSKQKYKFNIGMHPTELFMKFDNEEFLTYDGSDLLLYNSGAVVFSGSRVDVTSYLRVINDGGIPSFSFSGDNGVTNPSSLYYTAATGLFTITNIAGDISIISSDDIYLSPTDDVFITNIADNDSESHVVAINDSSGVLSKRSIVSLGNDLTFPNGIELGTPASTPLTPGTVYYDGQEKTIAVINGYPDVIHQVGQETYYHVRNTSGVTIPNGSVVYASGVDAVTGYLEIELAIANIPSAYATIGMTTHDIGNGAYGLVTNFGKVRGVNTSAFTIAGALYLSDTTPGAVTQTKPNSPSKIITLGTVLESDILDGVIHVDVGNFLRATGNKSYGFTSNGIGAGTYYLGGFYDAPAADVTLTQASTTTTYGTATSAYAAHAFVVAGGAGTVDTGQVGLRVTGTSIDDDGVLTTSDSQDLTDDITTLSTDDYLETPKKWVGTITYELYVVSGSPTTYSIDFNYGLCKYEDFANRDVTLSAFEAVGLASANDTNFDISLLKHDTTGWTYSATAFEPGNGIIVDWSDTMAPYDNLINGEHFAFKRTNLNTFIEGGAHEGLIVRVVTGTNNSVQSMDVHVFAELESF